MPQRTQDNICSADSRLVVHLRSQSFQCLFLRHSIAFNQPSHCLIHGTAVVSKQWKQDGAKKRPAVSKNLPDKVCSYLKNEYCKSNSRWIFKFSNHWAKTTGKTTAVLFWTHSGRTDLIHPVDPVYSMFACRLEVFNADVCSRMS